MPAEDGAGVRLDGLDAHLVSFARLLREAGIPVSPTQTTALARALAAIDVARRDDFKNAARALLVNRHRHFELFDQLFDRYWSARREGSGLELGRLLRRQPARRQRLLALAASRSDDADAEADPEHESALFAYSRDEILRQKDFAELTPEETVEIKRLLGELVFEIGERRTRRRIAARRGRRLDLRRVLRDSLRTQGDPARLAWRRRRRTRRPLVLICDVSASMEIYSRLLLQLAYAVGRSHASFEAFLFGTRLTRITRELRDRDVDRALADAAAASRDWGGGTRIGETLKEFNFTWARRVLGQGAVVAIISDGWDRGDAALLEREMARLKRSCQRLIWLNPLLGSADYEPLTRGIRTALPHVDDFLPVHNLASLEQLARLLAELPRGGRPATRRRAHA